MVVISIMTLLNCGNGFSQEKKENRKGKTPASLTPDQLSKIPEPDVNKAGERAKILLDKIEVLGTLSKPQAIFIIPGSDPQVDGIRIDRSFFMEIFRPVEKDFFPQKGRRKLRATIPW
ncbi:MAG: hypothetical protein D6814_13220 [Calditrichaeota bacterium]|nr:MAG: hypothetical protein D6814_13220 [Calditrichota bacterium]